MGETAQLDAHYTVNHEGRNGVWKWGLPRYKKVSEILRSKQ